MRIAAERPRAIKARSQGTHSWMGSKLPADSDCVCTTPSFTATSAASASEEKRPLLPPPRLASSVHRSAGSGSKRWDMCFRTRVASAPTIWLTCADRAAWLRALARPPAAETVSSRRTSDQEPPPATSARRPCEALAPTRAWDSTSTMCWLAGASARGEGKDSGMGVPKALAVRSGKAMRLRVLCVMMLMARHSSVAWSTEPEPPQHRILS
mmetsp:Transcript_85250/g.276037  ORF Transcript_85250/g.276037 Transcript_85250/m.276037 type:complete len:211 (-) Transcript_85250:246-878(-)